MNYPLQFLLLLSITDRICKLPRKFLLQCAKIVVVEALLFTNMTHFSPQTWSTSLHNRESLLFTNMVHFSPTSNLLGQLSPKTFFLVHFSPNSNLLEHFSPKTFFLVHISPNSNLLEHFSPKAFFLGHLLLDPLDPLHVLSREVWLTRLQNPLFNLLLDA